MKSLRTILAGAALLLATPLAAAGQDVSPPPGAALELMLGEASIRLNNGIYLERLEALDAMPGFEVEAGDTYCAHLCRVYMVESVKAIGPDGEVYDRPKKRLLSALEVSILTGSNPGSDIMNLYGQGLMGFQLGFNRALTGTKDPTGGIRRVDEYRGTGEAVTGYQGGEDGAFSLDLDPWMDPFAMMYAGGAMIVDASEGLREAEESLANSAAMAQAEADEQASMVSQFEEIGVEDVAGRSTVLYAADAPDLPVQEVGDQQFEPSRVSAWVDPQELVLVKHRFEGTATADGKSREFFIEVVNSDFRNPPGCGEMYEPYRRVLRMGGLLDDAQMAEMEEARRQLEEFERQMAELPADQRQMAERMMGDRMDAVRSLADGGVVEHVEEIEEILCDPDLKALFGVPGMENEVPDGLLVRIQQHLVALGYEPGNPDGVLDPMTRWAISEFQADHDLAVTGEPSAELEGLLAAEVTARDSN